MKKIRVIIADDIAATRENICKLMEFHPEITAVGQAATALEAIRLAKEIRPDVILMDVNMPGMDGIKATEILSKEVAEASIIMMSVQGEQEYICQSMAAGAKSYLVKPFSGDQLLETITRIFKNQDATVKPVHSPIKLSVDGKILTVFSTKGGIGKTTIATNLAVALAKTTGEKVVLIDGNLQFGDVAFFLNLLPRFTIADLVQQLDTQNEQLFEEYLIPYNENLKVLPAPFHPEQAACISAAHLSLILEKLRKMFSYIVVDTAPVFDDVMMTVLNVSDQVFVVSSMDLPTVKNVKLCMEMLESRNYAPEKMKVVLNRANSEGGMEPYEVEESLHCSFIASLPSEGKTVVTSVNKGIPFVISDPETPIAQGILDMAAAVAATE